MDTYVQVVSDEKRNAQNKVVEMLLPDWNCDSLQLSGPSVSNHREDLDSSLCREYVLLT
jgi:hypothetical protein